jgi:hypothetical protein
MDLHPRAGIAGETKKVLVKKLLSFFFLMYKSHLALFVGCGNLILEVKTEVRIGCLLMRRGCILFIYLSNVI